MLTTLQQAKKLKELGMEYKEHELHFIHKNNRGDNIDLIGTNDVFNDEFKNNYIPLPSVSEALEWFREVKGIECEVCLRLCFMGDSGEAVFGGYEYIVFDHNANKAILSIIYHNRNEVESALLEEVIKYVEK